jgi:hypothetical protein
MKTSENDNFLAFSCGHKEKVRCCESRDGKIRDCTAQVVEPNPICGHDLQFECHHRDEVLNFEPWPNNQDFTDFVQEVDFMARIDFIAPAI